MICENCGNIITTFEMLFFDREGSDYWAHVPINEVPDNAVYVDVPKHWTGDEMSEEEQMDSIRCPFCKQHPFKKPLIETHDFVRVVLFKYTAERKDNETD